MLWTHLVEWLFTLLVYIGKVIAVIDYRWHCYHMAIKTDMLLLSRCRWEHNIMIGRRCVKKKIFCVCRLSDVSAGDRRIYCGRRLSLSPLLHGDQSRHNAGCLTWSWEEWLVGSTPQRQMMMKVLCVVDEKDFLQFRRARAKIFFLSRACFRQHEQPILPGYPSETHVWKVNSRSEARCNKPSMPDHFNLWPGAKIK